LTLEGDYQQEVFENSRIINSKENNFHLGWNDDEFSDPSPISSKEGSPTWWANASAKCRNKFKSKIEKSKVVFSAQTSP